MSKEFSGDFQYKIVDNEAWVSGYYGDERVIFVNDKYKNYPVVGIEGMISNKTVTTFFVPDGVKVIGKNCFSFCENLNHIRLPDTLVSIESNTFSILPSIQSIKLFEGVSKIGHNAFNSCKSLKTIYLPKSLDYIGYKVLENCPALEAVYYAGDESDWRKIKAFFNEQVRKIVVLNHPAK